MTGGSRARRAGGPFLDPHWGRSRGWLAVKESARGQKSSTRIWSVSRSAHTRCCPGQGPPSPSLNRARGKSVSLAGSPWDAAPQRKWGLGRRERRRWENHARLCAQWAEAVRPAGPERGASFGLVPQVFSQFLPKPNFFEALALMSLEKHLATLYFPDGLIDLSPNLWRVQPLSPRYMPASLCASFFFLF